MRKLIAIILIELWFIIKEMDADNLHLSSDSNSY